MIEIKSFVFNEFQENTYILFDESNECIIFDPGCNNESEENQIYGYISEKKLKPVRLINTHCHIDHVLGNKFIADTYSLPLEIHKDELFMLEAVTMVGAKYQIHVTESPKPSSYLNENDVIKFGNSTLNILFTPGHSPGHLTFYNEEENIAIVGDVLFQNSIGRTDLPGGNYETLIKSIKEQLMPLHDDTLVYPGHGPSTTIGVERNVNPFLNN
ncbi:MAG: MBL fold metallo-hydrolase [Flavobacteriales bacterium]|nr:MBL fold metallo-hydrolase [Flavobacteriales bacterium]